MILVDTSIWIDFLRGGDPQLAALLAGPTVLCHPMIIGELACGNLPNRGFTLRRLNNLQCAEVLDDTSLLGFIEQHRLFGRGIGYVDSHLLASSLLGDARRLWTRDRRLLAVATDLGVAYSAPDAGTDEVP